MFDDLFCLAPQPCSVRLIICYVYYAPELGSVIHLEPGSAIVLFPCFLLEQMVAVTTYEYDVRIFAILVCKDCSLVFSDCFLG
jgi:hypothetical protein